MKMFINDEIQIAEKTLGIPYYRHIDDPKSHRYVNLRQKPDAIAELPELQDCPPLREFVSALNAPPSPFETFGCEKWSQPWSAVEFPGLTVRHGSYVDIAFVDRDLCATPKTYYQLIDRFRQYASVNRTYDVMHAFFALQQAVSANQSWWTLSPWIYGIGQTEKEAARWWAEGLNYLLTFLLAQDL
jgi:hypothetical protein